MKDLGLDSLDQVEIIMAMEDEFGESQLLVVMVASLYNCRWINYDAPIILLYSCPAYKHELSSGTVNITCPL